jgi:hypothetical protein
VDIWDTTMKSKQFSWKTNSQSNKNEKLINFM